ncbi:hypothetical protein AB0N17_44485 [Streptomyces sp. NPDC051133]|uniref:hypothetical protein n=1 Tax=Streptomyces sp. NPDC051133 TaxID=3155521 RepID=UPI0034462E52
MPSIEQLLINSGRVDTGAWEAAVTESNYLLHPLAVLVDRGMVGGGEMEFLLVLNHVDAAYAVFSGSLDAVYHRDSEIADPQREFIAPPLAVTHLLHETQRMSRRLASLAGPIVPDGILSASGVVPKNLEWMSPQQWSLVSAVNGQRTVRDIAFVTGRGLCAVILDAAFLVDKGLLEFRVDRSSGAYQHFQPPASYAHGNGTTGFESRKRSTTESQPEPGPGAKVAPPASRLQAAHRRTELEPGRSAKRKRGIADRLRGMFPDSKRKE